MTFITMCKYCSLEDLHEDAMTTTPCLRLGSSTCIHDHTGGFLILNLDLYFWHCNCAVCIRQIACAALRGPKERVRPVRHNIVLTTAVTKSLEAPSTMEAPSTREERMRSHKPLLHRGVLLITCIYTSGGRKLEMAPVEFAGANSILEA
jgi:hypothetical protein